MRFHLHRPRYNDPGVRIPLKPLNGVLGQWHRVAPVVRLGNRFGFNRGVVGPRLQFIQLAVFPIQQIRIARGL